MSSFVIDYSKSSTFTPAETPRWMIVANRFMRVEANERLARYEHPAANENKLHPMYIAARDSVALLESTGVELVIVPQVVYEYWVVATRPISANGLGLTYHQAEIDVDAGTALFRTYLDERGIFRNWSNLVRSHAIAGKPAHDARLVAAMQRHGISGVLTFNVADFTKFPFIHALSPDEVLNGAVFP